MARRINELKPKHGDPGHAVTGTDEYDYAPATTGADLALVARRRCSACIGECRVETPEWKAWMAKVGAIVERTRRAGNRGQEFAVRRAAEQEAGDKPAKRWEPCGGCDARGWNECEITLQDLARRLVEIFRMRGGKKPRLEVRRPSA